MPICPRHKIALVRVRKGLSYVCPRCDYKTYDTAKFWLPKVRHVIDLPSAFAWSTWTLTDVEESSSALVLTSGKLTGTAVSPQLINVSRHTDRYWDCTKLTLDWTHDANDGKVHYYASNDGGVGYILVKSEHPSTYNMNHGQELPHYKQQKYNDLRIKIELTRTSASDTSPSVSQLIVKHNKMKL